ncbi:MAG: hypothetical protein QOK43_1986 [Acidimicrobiaceae bacterium]|nr:hypothetical protein [Acidimicrobiaceae bacterium]
MSAVVSLRCDFCGAEAAEKANSAVALRATLRDAETEEAKRWERMGQLDCCPDCRAAPQAVGYRTRAVQWLIVHDDEILGHALSRKRALKAIIGEYGGWGRYTTQPLDRSGPPTFRVTPLFEGDPAEFAVECPDGVITHLVRRDVAEGYVDLCDCGEEVHYGPRRPRIAVRCWIGPGPGRPRDRHALYLDGWGQPLKTSDSVKELVQFARDHRYGEPDRRANLPPA